MRRAVAFVVAALVLSACGKRVEDAAAAEDQGDRATIAEFTLAMRCSDGRELYRLASGELVQWNQPQGSDGYFVKVEQSPTEYCAGTGADVTSNQGESL